MSTDVANPATPPFQTLQSHIDEDAQRHACKMLEILVLEHPGKLDQVCVMITDAWSHDLAPPLMNIVDTQHSAVCIGQTH